MNRTATPVVLALVTLLVLLVGSLACASPDPRTPAGNEGRLTCAQEIALECPTGQIDQCLAGAPSDAPHACIAKK